jgi:hypothetical protein
MWSDPFDENGELEVLLTMTNTSQENQLSLNIYPNPAVREININNPGDIKSLSIINANGQVIRAVNSVNQSSIKIVLTDIDPGIYIIIGQNENTKVIASQKFLKI